MDNRGVQEKKSKVKGRQHTCNTISAILKKDPDDAAQLTDTEIETTNLVAEHEAVPISGIRSGRPFLKNYENVDVGPSKSLEETNENRPSRLLTKRSKKS